MIRTTNNVVEPFNFLAKLEDGHKLSDNGEFDPGSGRTLAACFIHASRTRSHLQVMESGGRVSNM